MATLSHRSFVRRHVPPGGPCSVTAGLLILTAVLTVIAAPGCRTAPLSGRRQLVLIPEAQEIALGEQAYKQTLADEPLSQDQQLNEMVNRVGRRIAAVAGKPEYDWEFRVIAKETMNAFALPGGKVAVYEGILPVCQDEAGLAVVMSHEIAHALARHGGERMSQQSLASGIGGVINAVSQRKADEATAEKIMRVYGAASKYGVILPYSRKHESEADAIGLILMAKAGYDPSVAPEFWERFSRPTGSHTREWLSTHPADARRAADLRALLPEAMNYYRAAPQQLGMGEVLPLPSNDERSVAKQSSASPVSPLPYSSNPPKASQKVAIAQPPPATSKVPSDSSTGIVAAAAVQTPDGEDYRLPVPRDRSSSQSLATFKPPSRNVPIGDDGWSPPSHTETPP